MMFYWYVQYQRTCNLPLMLIVNISSSGSNYVPYKNVCVCVYIERDIYYKWKELLRECKYKVTSPILPTKCQKERRESVPNVKRFRWSCRQLMAYIADSSTGVVVKGGADRQEERWMFGVKSLLWLLSAVNEVKTTRKEQNSAEKIQRERKKGNRRKKILARMQNILYYICI